MPEDKSTAEALSLTLDNCDREPIHIPGTVQPFGCLMACDLSLKSVDMVSENLPEFLGAEVRDLLGTDPCAFLGEEISHDLRNRLSFSTARTQRERVGTYNVNDRSVEIFAHVNADGRAVVEFERAGPGVGGASAPIDEMRALLAKCAAQPTVHGLLRTGVVGLQALIGYDRVMAYRYAADGSGEVVAEALNGGAPSMLGLRYPAWDVPEQARQLQVKNPLRMLSDVNQEPVGLRAQYPDGDPLDLSLAHLRGISPIHVQYLRNMGVGATLTLGLVLDGRLWGMFACHHLSARLVGSDLRIAVELFAQMISLLIKEKLESEINAARLRAADARQEIVSSADSAIDLLNAFPQLSRALKNVVTADGLAVVREDKVQSDGSVPPPQTLHYLAARRPQDDNLLAGSECLMDDMWAPGFDLGPSGGCLIVRATAAYPLQLMFFRDEKVSKVTWAGKPQKELEDSEWGPRISPRGSFDAYQEEQRGRADPWDHADLAAARELQILLTQVTSRSERSQLSRQKDMLSYQRQQDLMIAELNHRVKNILALIRSLSRQAKQSSFSLESYARALEQRIAALAAAHDLAVSDSMTGVSLRSILQTELSPYQSAGEDQAILSGPLIGLRADVAPMIALLIHELTSNAAKYGALSVPEGIVQIRWNKSETGLSFSWREVSGPPVKEPTRHGFGRSLIERAIPYEFDGEVELLYEPAGLRCNFTLPEQTLVSLKEETPQRVVGQIGRVERVATGASVLVVEDNVVLAMDMVESMSRLGAEHIETAGTIENAMKLVGKTAFDLVALDMNLRGTVSFELARKLAAEGTPFLFVTGYGSKFDVPPELQHIPILTKPVDDRTLSSAMERLLPVAPEGEGG